MNPSNMFQLSYEKMLTLVTKNYGNLLSRTKYWSEFSKSSHVSPPPKFQFWIQSNFIEHVFLMYQWVRGRGEGCSERKLMKILFLFHLLCPVNDCATRDVFVCFKQTSFWNWYIINKKWKLSILRTRCFYHSKVLLNVVMSKKVVKIFETYQSKSSF